MFNESWPLILQHHTLVFVVFGEYHENMLNMLKVPFGGAGREHNILYSRWSVTRSGVLQLIVNIMNNMFDILIMLKTPNSGVSRKHNILYARRTVT